jgi:hypothetical protein
MCTISSGKESDFCVWHTDAMKSQERHTTGTARNYVACNWRLHKFLWVCRAKECCLLACFHGGNNDEYLLGYYTTEDIHHSVMGAHCRDSKSAIPQDSIKHAFQSLLSSISNT